MVNIAFNLYNQILAAIDESYPNGLSPKEQVIANYISSTELVELEIVPLDSSNIQFGRLVIFVDGSGPFPESFLLEFMHEHAQMEKEIYDELKATKKRLRPWWETITDPFWTKSTPEMKWLQGYAVSIDEDGNETRLPEEPQFEDSSPTTLFETFPFHDLTPEDRDSIVRLYSEDIISRQEARVLLGLESPDNL